MFQFFPIPFTFGLLIISYLTYRNRKKGRQFLLASLFFEAYLLFVVSEVFFPIPYSSNWPGNLSWANTQMLLARINWQPFYYGARFFDLSPFIWFFEIAGNVLFTVPISFGVYALFPASRKYFILLSIATGLAFESLQLIICLLTGFAYHAIDINDVFMNTLGMLLGYSLARLAIKFHTYKSKPAQK